MATNLDKSMLMTKSTRLLKLLCPCFLLTLIFLIIFIFTASSVATSSLPSSALHFHENTDASKDLLHLTSNRKMTSSVYEAPRTSYSPLRGRKMKTDDAATSTPRNSSVYEAPRTSNRRINPAARKHTNDMDSFVACADYGGPHRHPPKNN